MNTFCIYCIGMCREDKIPSTITEIHGSLKAYKNIVLQTISITNHDSASNIMQQKET